MKQVKTAKGRMIDMQALARANEEMRAVSPGNINMNARGDRIDKSGNVIQTVQSRSRAARDTQAAPEQRKMSETPGNKENQPPKKKKASAPAAKTTTEINTDPIVVREEEKTRDDGTRYLEIEYDDGSMEVKGIK
jgi:hypothetical protein